ncbi:hypothetical protein QP185_15435 [Sphingomonas aerolata]|uniref:hypothetical protein n=1 Tax=Sphingomonas aerolata TaxID=185951 RepID=UPI002FDF6049
MPAMIRARRRNSGARRGTIDGGLFRSRTHASSKARATALDAVVQDIARRPERPILPADVLALRTQPLR